MKQAFLKGISFNVILLGLASFLGDVSSEIVFPLLPLFIASLGGAGLAIGLIGGFGEAASNLLKVFAGYYSDKKGKRMPFVFSGYFLSALAKFSYAFLFTWPQVLLFRVIERMGKLRDAPRDAIIASSSLERVRGKAFGIHRALDSSGAIAGAILAFILFWVFGLNFLTIFIISGLIAFMTLIPLKFVKEPKFKPGITSFRVGLTILPKEFKVFLIPITLFALAQFTYMFFILQATAKLADNFLPAIALVLLLYVWFNVVYTSVSIPAGVFFDKFGRKNALIAGYLFFALTCYGFIIADSLLLFALFFATYGLFKSFVEGNQRAFASSFVSKELKGTALGTFHTLIGLAGIPASALAGFLWQFYSPEAAFYYGFALAVIAAFTLAAFKLRQ